MSADLDVHLARWWRPDVGSARALAIADGHLVVARDAHQIELLQLTPRPGVIMRLLGSPRRSAAPTRTHTLGAAPFNSRYFLTTDLAGYISLWSVELRRIVTEVAAGEGGEPIYDSLLVYETTEGGLSPSAEAGAHPCLLVATADKVKKYRITYSGDLQGPAGGAIDDSVLDSPEIVWSKTIFRATRTSTDIRCISLAMSESHLFVGTNVGTLLVYGLEAQAMQHTVTFASCSRKRRRKTKPEEEPKEAPIPEGMNVFEYLEEKERLEKQRVAQEEAERADALVHVMRLMYVRTPGDGTCSIFAGDNFGRTMILDGVSFTITQELRTHEGPITDFSVVDGRSRDAVCSVGADGKIVLYCKKKCDWVTSITRLAHLSDCTAVTAGGGAIIISGADGSLAFYEAGVRSLADLSQMPRRVHHTHVLGNRRFLPRVAERRRLIACVSPATNAVNVWTYLKQAENQSTLSHILEEARKRLRMKETKALDQFVVCDNLWQQVGESQWVPRRFGLIELKRERVYDVAWASGSDEENLWLLTDKGLRVISVDFDGVELTEGPKFKAVYPELAHRLLSSKRTIIGLEPGTNGRVFVTTADRSSRRSYKFSIFVVEPAHDAVVAKFSSLTSPPFSLVAGLERFAVLQFDGSVLIYSLGDPRAPPVAVPRLVNQVETTKGTLRDVQIFPASDAHMAFAPDDAFLLIMAHPNYFAAFDVEAGRYVSFGAGQLFTTPTISNVWSESSECLVTRAFVPLRREGNVVETAVITRRNRLIAELRLPESPDTVDYGCSLRDAERLSPNMEPDQICLGAVVSPKTTAWREMKNDGLLAFTVHRDTLERMADFRPYVRRAYGAG